MIKTVTAVDGNNSTSLGIFFAQRQCNPLRVTVHSVSRDAGIADSVQQGDELVAVNGQDVQNLPDMPALLALLSPTSHLSLDFIPADKSLATLATEAAAKGRANEHYAEQGASGPRAIAEKAERLTTEWNQQLGLEGHLAMSINMVTSALFAAQSVAENMVTKGMEENLGHPVHHFRRVEQSNGLPSISSSNHH